MPPRPSFSIWSHPRTPTYKTYIPSIRLIANSALTGIRLPTHPNTRYLTRRELRQITTSAPTTAKKTISMPSQPSKQTLEPEIISSEDIATDLKWVKLRKINWRDEDGKDRCWEAADRTTQPKNGIDAVAIFAILDHPSKPLSTIIIEQFRPPVGKYVVEFPAGLVDEGESAENTALRELHEETGYGGGKKGGGEATLESMTPLIVSDPGLTGATMKLAVVRVKLSEDDPAPESQLDEGEHIVTRIVPLKDLYEVLLEYDKKGMTVDARLAHFATGWHLRNQLKV